MIDQRAIHSFRDELEKIALNGLQRAAIGAATGGAAAELTGNREHAGKAMIAGALAPTIIKKSPKKLLIAGALGAPAVIAARSANAQANYEQEVGNQYINNIMNQPASDPGPWL